MKFIGTLDFMIEAKSIESINEEFLHALQGQKVISSPIFDRENILFETYDFTNIELITEACLTEN